MEVSTTMQDKNCHDGRERICINVDKVYDWIVKEKSFDINLTDIDIDFPGLPEDADLTRARFECEVTPTDFGIDGVAPVVILSREDRKFCIDGKTVELQQLNIQKNFIVTLSVTLANGVTYVSNDRIPATRCEHVVLCAPEETEVEVTYTALDCFICSYSLDSPARSAGVIYFDSISISVNTCQSIQSTFPVTVEFLADFCDPREDLPTACPAPGRPKQCPHVFPDFDHRRH